MKKFFISIMVLTAAAHSGIGPLPGGSGGGGGSGSVTSVGISAPSIFSVSGSPVTSAGTLGLSYSGTALPVANGGTSATSAGDALAALGGVSGPGSATDTYCAYWTGANSLGSDAGCTFNSTSNSMTLTGQYLSANGSVSAPGYSFSAETNLGMYRIGTKNYALSGWDSWNSAWAKAMEIDANGNVLFPIINDTGLGVYFGSDTGDFNIKVSGTTARLSHGSGGSIDFRSLTTTFASFSGTSVSFDPPVSFTPGVVDITADNQSVAVNTRSFTRFTSNSSTATDRTFVLGDGITDGQILYLVWNEDNTTGAGELLDSGNVNLSADWIPNIADTLTLTWNSGASEWQEVSRSNN